MEDMYIEDQPITSYDESTTYDEPAHDEPAHDEPAYDEPAHDEPAHDEPAHDEPAYDEPSYDEPTHDEPAHAAESHDGNIQSANEVSSDDNSDDEAFGYDEVVVITDDEPRLPPDAIEDPETGEIRYYDSKTGLEIPAIEDPETGEIRYYDPETGLEIDPQTGVIIDPGYIAGPDDQYEGISPIIAPEVDPEVDPLSPVFEAEPVHEEMDLDGDGKIDYVHEKQDTDGDGNYDIESEIFDTDGDGIMDTEFMYQDTTGDGKYNLFIGTRDTDGDGEPNEVHIGVDTDRTGEADTFVSQYDRDGDGEFETVVKSYDYNDDGLVDNELEYKDTDGDGNFDTFTERFDDDHDGIFDRATAHYDINGDGEEDIALQFRLGPDGTLVLVHDANDAFDYDTVGALGNGLSWFPADNPQFTPNANYPEGITGDPASSLDHWQYQGENGPCALYSQMFVIEEFTGQHINMEEFQRTAEENGWYGAGTSQLDMSRMLDAYGIENEMTFNSNFSDLEECLNNGGRVIVAIDAEEVWYHGNGGDIFSPAAGPNHAVEVIGVDRTDPLNPMVILNDSGTPDGRGEMVPLDTFMDAWADGRNQMIRCYPKA